MNGLTPDITAQRSSAKASSDWPSPTGCTARSTCSIACAACLRRRPHARWLRQGRGWHRDRNRRLARRCRPGSRHALWARPLRRLA